MAILSRTNLNFNGFFRRQYSVTLWFRENGLKTFPLVLLTDKQTDRRILANTKA